MLDTERNPVVHFGVITCRYLIYCTLLLLLLAPTPAFASSEDASCLQSTLRDQLRQSFKVLKLGHARNVKSCINLCCTKGICDLALLKKGRCYGISCSHHDLCRGIMNELRNKKRDISKRSISDTEDFPSEFSHHARSHGYCRQRRIVPHHVFLHGGRGVSNFHKLSNNIMSIRKCNQHCCEKKDCALAFLMRDKCYGVMCPDDGDCNSSDDMRVPVHLEIALVHRRDFTSKANVREETSTRLHKKAKIHHSRHHRSKSKEHLHRKSGGHLRSYRIKHHSNNRHVSKTRIHRHHKSKNKLGVGERRSHLPRKHFYHRRHKLKMYIRDYDKLRKKSGKVRNRKHRKIINMDDDDDEEEEEKEEEEEEKKKVKQRERERKKKKEKERKIEREKEKEKKEKEKKEKEKKEKEKKEKEKKEKEKKEKKKKEKEKEEKEKKEKEKDEEEEDEEDNENQEEDGSVKKIKEHSENDKKEEMNLRDSKKKRFQHRTSQNEDDEKNGQTEDLEDVINEEETKYLRNKNNQNRRKGSTKSDDNIDNDDEEDGEGNHDSKDDTFRNKIFHRKNPKISHNDEGDSEDNEKGEVNTDEDDEKDETNEQNDERETDNVKDNELSKTKEEKRKDKHEQKHSNTHFGRKPRFNKQTKTKLHHMRESYKHLNRKHEDGDSDETNDEDEKKKDEEENSDEDTKKEKTNDDFIHEETNEMNGKETYKVKEKSKDDQVENSHNESLEGEEHDKDRNKKDRTESEEDDGGRHVYNSDDDDHGDDGGDDENQYLKNQRRLERHRKKKKRKKKRKYNIGRKKIEDIDSNNEYDRHEKNHEAKKKHQETDETENEKDKETDRNEMDDDSKMNGEDGMNETKEKDDHDEIEDSDDYHDIMKKDNKRKKKSRGKNNKFDEEKIISKSNSDNIMSHNQNADNSEKTHEAQTGESYKRKDKVIQHEDDIMEDKVFEDHDNDFRTKRKKSKTNDKKKLRSKENEDKEDSEDQNENMDKMDDSTSEGKEDHDHGRNKYAEKKHHIPQTDSKSEGSKEKETKSWKRKFNEDDKISEDKHKPSKKENINDNEDDLDETQQDHKKDIKQRKYKSSNDDDNVKDSRTSKIHSERSKDKEGDSGTIRDDENHSGYTKSEEKSSKDEEDSDIMSDRDHSKTKDSEHKDYNIENKLHHLYGGDNKQDFHHSKEKKDHLYDKHRKQDNVDRKEESRDQDDERWRKKKILKEKGHPYYTEHGNDHNYQGYKDHLGKHRDKYDHLEHDGDKSDQDKGDHREDMEHSDDREYKNWDKQDEKHVKTDKKNQVGRQEDIKDNSDIQGVKDVYLHVEGNVKDTKDEKGDREDHKGNNRTNDDHKEDRSDMKDRKGHKLNWDNHKAERGNSEDHKEHSRTTDDHKEDRSDMKDHKDHEVNWDNHEDERGNSEDHKGNSGTNDDHKEDRSDMKDHKDHEVNWDNHKDEGSGSEGLKEHSRTSEEHKDDGGNMEDHKDHEVRWNDHEDEGSGSEGLKEHSRTSEEHKDDGGNMEDHKDHEVRWNDHEDEGSGSEGLKEHSRTSEEYKDDGGNMEDHKDHEVRWNDHKDEGSGIEGLKEHSRTSDDHKEDEGGKKNTIEDLKDTKDNTEDLKDGKSNRGDDKGIKDTNEDHKDDKGDSEDHKDIKENFKWGQENRKDNKDDQEDTEDHKGNRGNDEDNKGNKKDYKNGKGDREDDNYHRDDDESHNDKDYRKNQMDDKGDIEDHKDDNGIKKDHKDDKGNTGDDENHENKGNKENHKNEKGDVKYDPGSEEERQNDSREEKDRKDVDNNRIKNENNLSKNDNRTEEEKIKQNTEQDGTTNGDLRSKFHEKSDNKNRQKEETVPIAHPNVTKNEDYRENTDIDQKYGNQTTTNIHNANIKGDKNSVGRKQHGRGKMESKWKGENLKHKNEKPSSKLKDYNDFTDNNNSSKSKNNAEFPIHKKSLYHSLKNLKQEGNGIKPNVSNSDNDIMNINRNYTSNTDKNPQRMGEKKEGNKMKYFNQKTSGWRESNKGDDVDDHHEKYFNQATRHWAVDQPTKDSGEYFHKMTSGWSLKNQTQAHDNTKYFNQRTKEWVGKNHTFKQPRKNHSENVPPKRIHKPKGNLMKYKVHETIKNETVVEMNKIKHEEKQKNYVYQRKDTEQTYFPQPGHKKANKNNQTKIKPKSNEIHMNDQSQDLTSKSRNNKESSSNVGMSGNKSRGTDRQQNNIKIAKTTQKVEDNESADEKVKNEILKLLGQEPTGNGLSKKNETTKKENPAFREMPVLLNHNKSSSVQRIKSERPVIQLKHNALPTHNGISKKPEQKPKLISHLTEQHRQNNKKLFKSTFQHPLPKNRKNNERENNVAKNSKGATKIQTKPSFEKYFVALKKPKGVLANKRKYLPLNTFHKQKLNFPKQTRVSTSSRPNHAPNNNPKTLENSRRIIGKSDNTARNTNHVSKTWANVFPNSQIPTPPTPPTPTRSVQNWNKPNEWTTNDPWQQYYQNNNVQVPTVMPTSSWNNMDWYSKGSQQNNINTFGNNGIGNQNLILRTTPAPVYRNREYPLVNDGDKNNENYWKPEVGKFYGGSRQNEHSNMKPYSAMTPRRNYVHDASKQNNNKLLHVVQNNAKQTAKPRNLNKGFDIHKILNPVRNVSAFIHRQKKFKLAQPMPRIINYPNKNKVFNSTPRPLQHHEEHKLKPKSTYGNTKILQYPPRPHQNITKVTVIKVFTTSRPKIARTQWRSANTTSRIVNPFEVNKIQPLHPTKVARNVTKKGNRPLTTILKGCFPGEIMTEMTLENGLDAGNFTKIGRTELMDSCINKCCEIKSCEVAIQMDNVCFAVKCHSKEACKIKSTLGKSSHHKLSFISRTKKERQNMNDFDDDILGTEDVCPKEKAVGLKWKKTTAGTFDEIPCPKKAKGVARRKCSIESHWLLPDFSSCVTNDYEELYKRAKRLVYGEDTSSLLQSLATVTTRTIDNSLIFGGDLKKTTEIMTSIVQEQGVKQDNDISRQDLKNFLITCSNLLDDSNKQEWKNIQKKTRGSADILRDSQTFALLASSKISESQANVTYITNNIMLQLSHQVKGSKAMIFPDYSNTDIAIWDGEKDNLELPASVFSIGDTEIASFSYKTLPMLLPMEDKENFRHSEPNSKILTSIVAPPIQDKITPAVTITLHHLKENRVNPRCVFWDFNLNPTHGGAWSTKGCWLQHSDKKHSVCRCNHLSNFAVLMDIVDSDAMQVTSKGQHYSREMAAMWICVPMLVVLLIGGLYTAFTWSRGPQLNPRSLNERSSLLRSSVTTQEIRYDYSSSPSRLLYAGTSPKFKELEWQNEFGKHVQENKENTFGPSSIYANFVSEIELDSGIESNDLDDSSTRCDLSLSQDNLSVEESTEDFCTKKEIESTESEVSESEFESNMEQRSPQLGRSDTHLIRMEVERRIFLTNLRRCIGSNDLSSNKT